MSNAAITTGWTASTHPGGRAGFRQHLADNWAAIQAAADRAADQDRARPDFAARQWLAFERDYHDRILVDEAAEEVAA